MQRIAAETSSIILGYPGWCRSTRLAPSGAELVASLPAEFGAWLKAQRALLGKLITDANIKLG